MKNTDFVGLQVIAMRQIDENYIEITTRAKGLIDPKTGESIKLTTLVRSGVDVHLTDFLFLETSVYTAQDVLQSNHDTVTRPKH